MDIKIGEDLYDRWATFFIYEHQGKKYACVGKVLIMGMMTEGETEADSKTNEKDFYAYDAKKVQKFFDRALNDHRKKLKEFNGRAAKEAANDRKLSVRVRRMLFRLVRRKEKRKEIEMKYSKMDEVVRMSLEYHGDLKVGDTFQDVRRVVDVTKTSVCMRMNRVTHQGLHHHTQWFAEGDFKKRFIKQTTMENRGQGDNSLDA